MLNEIGQSRLEIVFEIILNVIIKDAVDQLLASTVGY